MLTRSVALFLILISCLRADAQLVTNATVRLIAEEGQSTGIVINGNAQVFSNVYVGSGLINDAGEMSFVAEIASSVGNPANYRSIWISDGEQPPLVVAYATGPGPVQYPGSSWNAIRSTIAPISTNGSIVFHGVLSRIEGGSVVVDDALWKFTPEQSVPFARLVGVGDPAPNEAGAFIGEVFWGFPGNLDSILLNSQGDLLYPAFSAVNSEDARFGLFLLTGQGTHRALIRDGVKALPISIPSLVSYDLTFDESESWDLAANGEVVWTGDARNVVQDLQPGDLVVGYLSRHVWLFNGVSSQLVDFETCVSAKNLRTDRVGSLPGQRACYLQTQSDAPGSDCSALCFSEVGLISCFTYGLAGCVLIDDNNLFSSNPDIYFRAACASGVFALAPNGEFGVASGLADENFQPVDADEDSVLLHGDPSTNVLTAFAREGDLRWGSTHTQFSDFRDSNDFALNGYGEIAFTDRTIATGTHRMFFGGSQPDYNVQLLQAVGPGVGDALSFSGLVREVHSLGRMGANALEAPRQLANGTGTVNCRRQVVVGMELVDATTQEIKRAIVRVQFPIPSDVNGDGIVDLIDYFEFFSCYDLQQLCADLNADGAVDLLDFFIAFEWFQRGGARCAL